MCIAFSIVLMDTLPLQLHFCVWGGRSYLAFLSGNSWLCTQNSLWDCSGKQEMPGIEAGFILINMFNSFCFPKNYYNFFITQVLNVYLMLYLNSPCNLQFCLCCTWICLFETPLYSFLKFKIFSNINYTTSFTFLALGIFLPSVIRSVLLINWFINYRLNWVKSFEARDYILFCNIIFSVLYSD